MITQKRELGDLGEKLAGEYLEDKGYAIIDRNYSTKFGEIDIVAEKDGALLFVEVKTTSHASVLPEENITFRKLKCLLKTIEIYLMDNGVDYVWQLDSIAVLMDNETRKAQIRHLKNINIS